MRFSQWFKKLMSYKHRFFVGERVTVLSPPVPPTISLGTATSSTQPIVISGGSGAISWLLQFAIAGSGDWTTFSSPSPGSTSVTVTGLASSTSFDYRIVANNSDGTTYSNTVTGSTATASGSFNFYISPVGSDSNDGLTTSTPWAITALNSRRATYAGQTIGLMDGTYDIHTMTAYNGGTSPKLGIAPGTTGNPTVVKAINARLAIIDNTGTSNDYPAIGQSETTAGYCTLKDIVVKGCTQHSILFKYEGNSSSNQGVELTIDGCEIKQQLFGSVDITIGLFIQGFDVATVTNNYFHDIHNSAQEASCAGIEMYGCRGNKIEQNTFTDVHTGIYDKYAAGSVDMQGTEIRRNYFLGLTNALLGFDNRGQTAVPPSGGPFNPYIIENNVFEGCAATLENPGSFSAEAHVYFRNNTIYSTSGAISGPSLHTKQTGCEPYCYNNITYNSGTWSTWRAVTISRNGAAPAAVGVLDYNCYGPSSANWQYSNVIGEPYSGGGSEYNVVTTIANWRTATSGEAGSIVNDPSFAMTGSNANRFQLGGSSPCLNAGHVGGTSGGATRHMGAWDGVVTQIGKSW